MLTVILTASALASPTLSISGACPGVMSIDVAAFRQAAGTFS